MSEWSGNGGTLPPGYQFASPPTESKWDGSITRSWKDRPKPVEPLRIDWRIPGEQAGLRKMVRPWRMEIIWEMLHTHESRLPMLYLRFAEVERALGY